MDVRRWPLIAIALLCLVSARAALAVECAQQQRVDASYVVCRVAVRTEQLRLAYAGADGRRFESFEALRESLARAGRKLTFAMNAGMFHPDFRPVGLLVIDGRNLAPINRASGTGNFFLQPNGVFLLDSAGARVLATDEYRGLSPTFATQSGPMLVHHGQIPASGAFRAGSTSRHLRNGVCAPTPGEAVFVISEDAVSFHEFANFFRATLGCDEALYLDGSISSLYATQLRRADHHARLGPMFAVAE